jgi:peptide-methionine (R)-S-oxide reductase
MASKELLKSEEEWAKTLTKEQYKVLRMKSTELPFTGKLLFNKKDGIYRCAACGNKLFSSKAKFESGTGWPSFDRPLSDKALKLKTDKDLFMTRTEIICAKCGSHLGHVFDDGPTETKKRFCLNSCALDFKEELK